MDPWSKGDYSRHIQEALMVVEKLPKVNHSSGRVRGHVRWAAPILESRRRRNRGRYREKGSVLEGFWIGVGPSPKRPAGAARGHAAPAGCLGGACDPSGSSSVIPEASCTLILYYIFLEFLEHFK